MKKNNLIRLLIAAPASGSGKTIVTCALLSALRRRGLRPCAFKCGPDYIDPMFHRAAAAVESRNLDLFLSDPARLRHQFARAAEGHGAAVCEGAMGFYDGLGAASDQNSAWHIADTLDLPVLLVVRAKGAALSLAALVRGMRDFRANSHIAAVLLNRCTPSLCETLAPVLKAESGIPVIGCLPEIPAAEIQSRRLGLYPAPEIPDLRERLRILAEALETHVDMDQFLKLFRSPVSPLKMHPPVSPLKRGDRAEKGSNAGKTEYPQSAAAKIKIAVAHDAAFCFLYAETLETLKDSGAELAFFSPLRDRALPEGACGLYLPGGYPEAYAQTLAENLPMRRAVAAAMRGKMPTVAEGGGFLYLGQSLQDSSGRRWPMAGVLPGEGFPAGKLVRFGYAALEAETDSLLFRKGERIPVHEFHYWDSTDNGTAFRIEKAAAAIEKPAGGTQKTSGRNWRGGFASDCLYAAFPHLYLAGRPVLADRFVHAARRYNPPESPLKRGDSAEKSPPFKA